MADFALKNGYREGCVWLNQVAEGERCGLRAAGDFLKQLLSHWKQFRNDDDDDAQLLTKRVECLGMDRTK